MLGMCNSGGAVHVPIELDSKNGQLTNHLRQSSASLQDSNYYGKRLHYRAIMTAG